MAEKKNPESGWESQEEDNQPETQSAAPSKFVSNCDKNSNSRESYDDNQCGRGDSYSDRGPRGNDRYGDRGSRGNDKYSDRGSRDGDRYSDRGSRGNDRYNDRPLRGGDRFDDRLPRGGDRYDDRPLRGDDRYDDRPPRGGDRFDDRPPRGDRFDDRSPRGSDRYDDRPLRGDDRMDMLQSKRRYYDGGPRFDPRRDHFGGREDYSFREKRPRTRQDEAAPNPTLGIFSLSYNLMQRDFDDYLASKLTKFKSTYTTKLILDQMTGKCKGFGFVTFENIQDSTEAKGILDNGELLGVPYRVAFSIGEKRTNNFQRRPDDDSTRRDAC